MRLAILTLGKKEAEKMLAESETIAVTCEYCNTEYEMNADAVMEMFKEHGAQ